MDTIALTDALITGFNEDELDDLLFKIGVPEDELSDGTLRTKAREAVLWCERRGKDMLNVLVVECFKARPNLYWNQAIMDVPAGTLRRMIPNMNGETTGRLRGVQMARIEKRQYAQAACLHQVKSRVSVALTLNAVTLLLVFMLLAKGLA